MTETQDTQTRRILHRSTNAVRWEGPADTVTDAIHSAFAAGADLTGADLTPIRDDIWAVLSGAPAEVPTLLAKLRAGEVDGSCYSGTCACLVGTLANARGCDYTALGAVAPNSSRPAERFFASIDVGDTPETSQFAKLADEWISDWLTRMQAAFGPQER